jgi:hypothetical protein
MVNLCVPRSIKDVLTSLLGSVVSAICVRVRSLFKSITSSKASVRVG